MAVVFSCGGGAGAARQGVGPSTLPTGYVLFPPGSLGAVMFISERRVLHAASWSEMRGAMAFTASERIEYRSRPPACRENMGPDGSTRGKAGQVIVSKAEINRCSSLLCLAVP